MTARVLVVNAGSSSLKYRLFERADDDQGPFTVLDGGTVEHLREPADHERALRQTLDHLDVEGLTAVGHRVVHGGLDFTEPTIVDDQVLTAIERLAVLAPTHNPANLAGITRARALLPDVPQVAVFDTAFHRTLPPAASTYALDPQLCREHDIHRYGFHGTSHAYVSRRTADLLGRPYTDVNTISLHLGNGASACAVAGGRSIATTMGLTPLEGLVMGTRSGDLDPAIVLHLQRHAGLSVDDVDTLLNKHSGLQALCGDSDMREVLRRSAAGDPAATLARDVYCHHLTSYVGAYYALLGRVDAITFTAGVGENAAEIRARSLAGLDRLGITVDPARNTAAPSGARVISPDGAEVTVCVIPTDEEHEIATRTLDALTG